MIKCLESLRKWAVKNNFQTLLHTSSQKRTKKKRKRSFDLSGVLFTEIRSISDINSPFTRVRRKPLQSSDVPMFRINPKTSSWFTSNSGSTVKTDGRSVQMERVTTNYGSFWVSALFPEVISQIREQSFVKSHAETLQTIYCRSNQ